MRLWTFALALLASLIALPAFAQTSIPSATVESPGKTLSVTLAIGPEARASYTVSRNGQPVIAPSLLGFLFTDAPQFARDLEITNVTRSSFDDTWTQPWGEWRTIRNHYNEMRVRLREVNKLHRSLDVVFRVYDNGIGFRYEFEDGWKSVNIAEELTQFSIAEPATAWWSTAFESNREEQLEHQTPIAEIGTAQTPLTLKTASGLHIAIHEAALVDYSGMNVAKVQGGLLKAVLTPSSSGPKVSREAPFPTPWRVLLIAPDAPSLYMANPLILNLNEPNKLGDVSWVHPRKYVGIWWGMHLDIQSWNSGPKHGATTANVMKMIDFAAANGFGGVLVEGWNVGWDGDWFANGSTFSFTQPYPDYDLQKVTAYARSKHVVIIGHNETSANIAHYEEQMRGAFDLYQKLGIDTVKTGYVSDAGGVQAMGADGKIHFEWHEGQVMARHHLLVVTEAAKRHIAIDAHEPIKDTGLRRTYPNWVSREGQRGMEYNAWGVPKNPPNWESELVFTRMLGGPFDFTPGVLSLKGRGDTDILSTIAKQLALYVVIYSPIQMAADLPENYAKYPGLFQFIKDVAVDWDDTRVLNGEVGQYVTIVRKAKGSGDWFLGSVGDDTARKFDVSLDFLSPGKTYTAQIYRDGDDADYRTDKRHSIVIETRRVKKGDVLTIALAPGGGQAIRFKAGR
ncbi:MAG: glycoside hydrolase family 97 protein [Sphingomonas sp.]|uniref:glycoside hydrolase family 97 protein n=1 Tax=Sphingomonas sp. TaxID=28214 RepID=UPI001200B053|nr:glycoside hydrolase family 97 protein [Sphingomonas sp.]THD35249.1 MAG: glycoside hydrolase family 97 protein [Sphingomonas sp.]